jgi:hypothetical protein
MKTRECSATPDSAEESLADRSKAAFRSPCSWAERHPLIVIGGLLLLCLAPFLNKAIHIDDPLFVWAAEWIQKHPLDFYGFNVNWYGLDLPMHIINQNPPGVAYVLALVGSLVGWREIILHAAFVPVAFATAAGIYHLARIWCERPLLATLVAIVTPVFLVSSTTLMCDLLMLAFWVWAVVVWERALKPGGDWRFLAAGGLAGLAVLTKYSALTLLPVLFLLGVMRKRRLGWWLPALLVPAAMFAAFRFITQELYHHDLFSLAAAYAARQHALFKGGWIAKLTTGFVFAGGCLLPLLFFAPLVWSRKQTLCGGVAALGLCLGLVSSLQELQPVGLASDDSVGWGLLAQEAILMIGGLHLLVLTAVELRKRRGTVDLVLALWIFTVFLFSTVLNWTVSARSLLPVVPAAAILLVRRLSGRNATGNARGRWLWPLVPSLAAGLCVTMADVKHANSARTAARQIAARYQSPSHTLWFQGHWGFQYYMEKLGARPVDFQRTTLQPGDILVMPWNNSNTTLPKPGEVELLEELRFEACPWLSTMKVSTGAGFYAADYGPLPFAVGPALRENYSIFKVLRPLQFRSSLAMYRQSGESLPQVLAQPPSQADAEAALEANPNDAKAHAQLALLLTRQGKIVEAIGHYREALRITPDDPAVLNNLAWLLTAARSPELRDGKEAVRLATRAVELTHRREPMLLGTLAAAHAEAGEFAQAVEAAKAACDLAAAAGQEEMVAMNEKLLELYRAGKTVQQMTNPP